MNDEFDDLEEEISHEDKIAEIKQRILAKKNMADWLRCGDKEYKEVVNSKYRLWAQKFGGILPNAYQEFADFKVKTKKGRKYVPFFGKNPVINLTNS